MKGRLSMPMHLVVSLSLATSGCAALSTSESPHPSVAPTTQPATVLQVDAPPIPAMYYHLLPVDLPTTVRLAQAQNIEIRQARERVEASRGRYQGSVESLFPVIGPVLSIEHLRGVNQNANGTLVRTDFTNVMPSGLLNWIINPGQVIYDILAAKRQLQAADQQAQSVVQKSLQTAAEQYYDLVLTQAQVAMAQQTVKEADESLRLDRLRLSAGTMLPADALRSEATLAEAQQALNTALNGFHDASIALALTLHLDPTVMLVPQAGPLHEATLVRDDLSVDDMLAAAVGYRPDLQAARKLFDASRADQHAIVWAELGPKFQAAYANGSLAVHVTGQDDDFHAQQRSAGTVGFALGLSAQGHLKTAHAETQLATLDTVAKLDEVRAAVVTSHQACIAASKSIPLAAQQVSAAKEALQLAQDHARTGTMLAFDVLRAQTVEAQAQLSYASAIVRYNQAEVALLSTLGLLDQNTVHAGLD